ncbi:MAG TPA: outer membrane beta-barrel protein [Candidatus Solibacter sp.]|nr:outer membrane beta-barrel protein [Candidatus Solibacter sp.]
MRIYSRRSSILVCFSLLFLPGFSGAQPRTYAGALGGIATLSADSRTVLGSDQSAASSYKPDNGPMADIYFGVHWNNYLSIQADYIWNRNSLTLDGLATGRSNTGNVFYEQAFQGRQHAALGNVLLYFRPRSSWVRPFLSAGTGIVHLTAGPDSAGVVNGLTPPGAFSATKPALHVAVGIDLKHKSGWGFRYSFAETSSANPISRQLTPPGSRMLATFRNLFGVVKYF